MNIAILRIICSAAAAGAITAMAALSATTGNAASIGKSITVEVKREPVASIQELKAQYRRPTSISFPKDNPYTIEKVDLGKKLYFDTRLSAANLLSCASCHSPAYGWGDGQPKGVGHGMKQLGRRSPTIVNAAFGQIFMWDGRASSLEELAPESIAKAIATYERTVVSGRAPFDAWIEGDEKAISEQAKRGFTLFNTKAGCSNCHSGWNFTDDSFHDTGLPDGDIGRGNLFPSVAKMGHAFKHPGLREITRRGPHR